MIRLGSCAVGTALLVMMTPIAAVAQDEHAGHHPPALEEAPAAPPKATKPADDQHGMMGGNMMSGGQMCSGMMSSMSDHIEDHLSQQRSKLGITPAQAGAWTAYANALRKAAADMDRMHQTMMGAPGGSTDVSPVERLDRHDRMLGMMRDNLRGLRPALVQLYASLSPQQKQKANSLLMAPGMMRDMPMGQMKGM